MNHDDEVLLDRLRAIAAIVDDPPPWLDQAARAALSWRILDTELAELMLDSDLSQAALVRAADNGVRLLSFETASVSVELQIEDVDGRLTLRGLVSGASGDAIVEMASGSRVVPINAQGWFVVDDLPRGAIRVRLRALDGTTVTTSWVSV
jgi:hypothetical protein